MLLQKEMGESVRIVAQEFGAIEDEAQGWSILADESNIPMHQCAWVKACITAFACYGRLHVHNLTSWVAACR